MFGFSNRITLQCTSWLSGCRSKSFSPFPANPFQNAALQLQGGLLERLKVPAKSSQNLLGRRSAAWRSRGLVQLDSKSFSPKSEETRLDRVFSLKVSTWSARPWIEVLKLPYSEWHGRSCESGFRLRASTWNWQRLFQQRLAAVGGANDHGVD